MMARMRAGQRLVKMEEIKGDKFYFIDYRQFLAVVRLRLELISNKFTSDDADRMGCAFLFLRLRKFPMLHLE